MEIETTNHILQSLEWRYATKKFDDTKKLNDDQLALLLKTIQLTPSSYGLQPYKVIVITNQEVKDQLKAAAFGQTQLTDASHIFVFARTKNYNIEHVEEFAQNIIETRAINMEAIQAYVDVMKGTINARSQEELATWNAKQAYIGLGFLLETAALNEIDACPMEGFNPAAFDEILGLDEKNLTSVVIAPVGFRSEEDTFQEHKKVRKSHEDLFIYVD